MEKRETFEIDLNWINQLLSWGDHHFPYMAYFNPNSIAYPHDGFEQVFFAGENSYTWDQLKNAPADEEKIGILGYDLKNRFERLQSNNPSLIACPETLFFTPSLKIKFNPHQAEIFHPRPFEVFDKINSFDPTRHLPEKIKISACTTKEEYLQQVRKIKNNILEGDIYEMNYCMAFKGHFEQSDPVQVYLKLIEKSPMPFSALFKADKKFIVGASPERFLKKSGNTIIAQPIKGTVKRGATSETDKLLRQQLQNSEKERAENLMIVDLMRNDLSRISETGKVKVEELFGVYSFKKISQMISTVSSTLREPTDFEDIIAKTFPMGSMTGAPKIRCMELIDQYENFQRGWFSGALGYISASKDFDFNVVIRSIIMDKETGRLFFAVGSAITFDADPEQEYEECLLKAAPIFEVLTDQHWPG